MDLWNKYFKHGYGEILRNELVWMYFYEYKEDESGISIYIVDIEAHPESNPTISRPKKYLGIGRMMIAFGIHLSIDASLGGIVTFAAKTDELLEHYIKDFGAIPIAQPMSGGSKLLMIADESAQEIFSTYLS